MPSCWSAKVRVKRSLVINSLLCGFIACGILAANCSAQSIGSSAVNVRIVTDEADAVLAILAKQAAHQTTTEADWQRLFNSEGYVRLKRREAAMRRSFADEEFKTFVLSEPLAARASALADTLAEWKRADITRAAGLALAYLPPNARIQAKIYPVIKPRENSF